MASSALGLIGGTEALFSYAHVNDLESFCDEQDSKSKFLVNGGTDTIGQATTTKILSAISWFDMWC